MWLRCIRRCDGLSRKRQCFGGALRSDGTRQVLRCLRHRHSLISLCHLRGLCWRHGNGLLHMWVWHSMIQWLRLSIRGGVLNGLLPIVCGIWRGIGSSLHLLIYIRPQWLG